MHKLRHPTIDRHAPHQDAGRRSGSLLVDLVIAASLLMCLMTVLATFTIRSGRLWQQVRHQQLALDELSNQLERLIGLDEDRRSTAISELTPSESVTAMLPGVALTSEVHTDPEGSRIVLSIDWERGFEAAPLQLVGWVSPAPTDASATAADAPTASDGVDGSGQPVKPNEPTDPSPASEEAQE